MKTLYKEKNLFHLFITILLNNVLWPSNYSAGIQKQGGVLNKVNTCNSLATKAIDSNPQLIFLFLQIHSYFLSNTLSSLQVVVVVVVWNAMKYFFPIFCTFLINICCIFTRYFSASMLMTLLVPPKITCFHKFYNWKVKEQTNKNDNKQMQIQIKK